MKLENGHWVKTADGTLARVRYVNPRYDASRGYTGETDVEVETGPSERDSITLDISELRRVPSPENIKPPIEGMPEERPACQWCGKKFSPRTTEERQSVWGKPRILKRTWTGWNCYRNLFCTMGCALDFATASYRGGYRRVNKK